MSRSLAERLGIDQDNPSAQLAAALVEADDHLMRSLASQRGARGVTVEQVAELTGFTAETVLAVEHGSIDPSLSMIRRIAHAIGVLTRHQVAGAPAHIPAGDPEAILAAIEDLDLHHWSAEPSGIHDEEWAIMIRSTDDLEDPLLEATGLTYVDHGTMDEAPARYIATVSPHRIAPLLRELIERRQG